MRYVITGIAILLGAMMLITSFVAGQQFREIASSPVVLSLDDYPFLDFVGGDLLRGSNDGATPAEMAQLVQQRLGLIALGGLIFLLVGVVFFTLTMAKKNGSNSNKAKSGHV